jgi:uncharacterized SAM-binding protein YcdF (DUF218 family)
MRENADEKETRLKIRTLIIACLCLLVGYGSYRGWVNLGTWLTKADDPNASEVIVCLSDIERIIKAADLYRKGFAPQIILTAEKEKKGLTSLGVPEGRITLAPGPKTTYQEVLAVAPILREKRYRSALVVTDPYPLRRVRWTFRHVFKNQPIELIFVASDRPWKGEGWWQHKEEKLRVYSEVFKMAWYWLAHGLLRMPDDPPWSIDLKHRYQAWLTTWVNG